MKLHTEKKFPEGWKWVKLSDVGTFMSGGTPSKEVAQFWNGDIPFVTGADITDFYIGKNNARQHSSPSNRGLFR